MAGPETVFEMVHISLAEIAEESNIITFWRNEICLFADTFTYVGNCYRK